MHCHQTMTMAVPKLQQCIASFPGHSNVFNACNIENMGVAWGRGYRWLKAWMFISLRSVNRMYAYTHWWSKIHYGYGKKCSKTRINSKDSCHSSIATIMDTSMADLTTPRLSGADRFLGLSNKMICFWSPAHMYFKKSSKNIIAIVVPCFLYTEAHQR